MTVEFSPADLTKGWLLLVYVEDGVREGHDAARVCAVPEPERVPELMDGFLCCTLEEKLAVWWPSVKSLVETMEGDERDPPRALGLAEDEVEIPGGSVEVDIEQRKHLVFTSYAVNYSLEDEVGIVLLSGGVVSSGRNLKRSADRTAFDEGCVGFL